MSAYPLLPAASRRALLRWFREQGRDLPWRRTSDPYAVTVSEFMLQQTRVNVVVDYYHRWMKKFPTVQTLAAAPESDVLAVWQGLGYYSRARNLHRLAQVIVEKHHGVFPCELHALQALPGIGPYTAAAIRAFAFDLPAPVVDANVARVLARWADYRGPIDSATGIDFLASQALAHQPESASAREWNSAVMELGALLCTSGRPDCLLCPVRNDCRARDPEALPIKRPRQPTTALTEHRALILHKGRLWLLQSPGPRWRGLWILPQLDPPPAGALHPLCTIIYPITRYRVRMEVHLHRSIPPGLRGNLQPHNLAEWADLPLAAPHRRAVAQGLDLVHIASHA